MNGILRLSVKRMVEMSKLDLIEVWKKRHVLTSPDLNTLEFIPRC